MDELMAVRIAKLGELQALGMEGYPPRAVRSHTAAEVVTLIDSAADVDALLALPTVDVVGRVVARRDMGKATFIDLLDGSGRIQALFRQHELRAEL